MKKKFKTVIVLPDIHLGEEDPRAINLAFQILEEEKPEEVIIIGDLLEMEAVSKWPKTSPETKYLKDEFEKGNNFLDRLQKVTKKITYIEGNHSLWLREYINNKCPELAGLLDLETGLKLKERNIKLIPHGIPYQVGKKIYIHGIYTCKNHALKHGEVYGKSVTYGHLHSYQSATIVSYDRSIRSTCIGCLCKLDKKFLKGKPTGWSHGIQINYMFSDGTFSEYYLEFIGYRVIWKGKVFSAQKET
jgi:UDP-2,3-diacylglucosamine pyrophosphatase LpxH